MMRVQISAMPKKPRYPKTIRSDRDRPLALYSGICHDATNICGDHMSTARNATKKSRAGAVFDQPKWKLSGCPKG